MTAHELKPGTVFRVVGLPDWWEVLKVQSGSVHVRPMNHDVHSFETTAGVVVTVSFRPKAFYISRETSVEVAP